MCPIAVVGAGIGGLSTGLALLDQGVPVTVFEQSRQLREVGAGIAVGANGSRLLRRLGLGEQLADAAHCPPYAEFVHWQTGKVFQAHELRTCYEDRFGAPFYTVHRADMQRLLADVFLSRGGDLRMGHRCVGISERADHAEIEFSNGTRFPASLVVGADGVHSAIRAATIGPDQAVFSGASGYRGLARIERTRMAGLADGALWMFLGPYQHVIAYPVRDGGLVNFLAVIRDPQWTLESWSEPGEISTVLSAFEGWGDAACSVIAAADEVSRWALYDREPLHNWTSRRTTLLGDAAHPMLPHQGQGANQAIEDAVVLAACVAQSGASPQALQRYQRLRRARTRQVQAGSRKNARCFQLPDGPEADQRNKWLQRLPDALAWIHGYDAEAELAGA